MSEPRTVSVEAVALRAQSQLKAALNDALILQENLLEAHQQIKQLYAELEHLKAKKDGDQS